ncbi:MAG: sulfurtransferase complex subunit TusB [Candidatus Hodarchaeota archaeon]
MAEKHDFLYLVGYNSREYSDLAKLLDILGAQSGSNSIGVVLIQDGVIGLSKKGRAPAFLSDLMKLSLKVYAMVPDLKARGIQKIIDGVDGIEYGDLVDLMVDSTKVVSWL